MLWFGKRCLLLRPFSISLFSLTSLWFSRYSPFFDTISNSMHLFWYPVPWRYVCVFEPLIHSLLKDLFETSLCSLLLSLTYNQFCSLSLSLSLFTLISFFSHFSFWVSWVSLNLSPSQRSLLVCRVTSALGLPSLYCPRYVVTHSISPAHSYRLPPLKTAYEYFWCYTMCFRTRYYVLKLHGKLLILKRANRETATFSRCLFRCSGHESNR